ncbi:MAG: helix-turn-helix transcriptional regulator [Dehalococcoidales bacterium]|jgi:transcriptional regulator with XRE-family HTH domain
MSGRINPDPYLLHFGSHIRSLRKRAELSQEDVADKAGIHVTYLSGIERGLRNPALKNIRRLAQALGVPTKELFDFEEYALVNQFESP